MATSVQFTNKDDVIEAYKKMKVAPFAIWCGKAMNFSCTGETDECLASLIDYLEMLDRQELAAHYTLCVYDELEAGEHINNKTPYSASFNFRLAESAAGIRRLNNSDGGLGGMTVGGLYKQWEKEKLMLDELKALRMEVQELKDGGGEVEEMDDYGLGKIGKILQHPQIGPMAQQLVGGIIGWLNSMRPGTQPPAVVAEPGRIISGIPPAADQLATDLGILNKAYPDFPQLLNKLATMRQKHPAQLDLYINALRTMNV